MGLDAAIITGSTSGIGLGIARCLAASGRPVVLNGLGDSKEIERLRQELSEEFAVPVLHNSADMSDPPSIENLIETAQREFGRIGVLINNAGIQFTAPIHKFPIERWNAILSINLSAAFHAIRTVLPGMLEAGSGRIINIASTHGLVASKEKAAYVAAKHGVVGLTKVVALETAGSGVTCNSICPGWVLTPIVVRQILERASSQGLSNEEAEKALLAEKQPSGQFATPQQIGDLAVFLCSPAADQVTGQAIAVDGGWTAQ